MGIEHNYRDYNHTFAPLRHYGLEYKRISANNSFMYLIRRVYRNKHTAILMSDKDVPATVFSDWHKY